MVRTPMLSRSAISLLLWPSAMRDQDLAFPGGELGKRLLLPAAAHEFGQGRARNLLAEVGFAGVHAFNGAKQLLRRCFLGHIPVRARPG